MARIRTIKPEFFTHEGLYEAEQETGLPLRVAYAGLWCQCDREGRFKWRPRELKLGILPYDDIDFSRVLDALATRGYLVRYACGTEVFGYIPSFAEHQQVNNREAASTLPSPTPPSGNNGNHLPTREPRVEDASATGEARDTRGKERKGKEVKSFNPPSPPFDLPSDANGDTDGDTPTTPQVVVPITPPALLGNPEVYAMANRVATATPEARLRRWSESEITYAHRVAIITAAKHEAHQHGVSMAEAMSGLLHAVEAQVEALPPERWQFQGTIETYFRKHTYRVEAQNLAGGSNGTSERRGFQRHSQTKAERTLHSLAEVRARRAARRELARSNGDL